MFDEDKIYLCGDEFLHDRIAPRSTMAKWRMVPGRGPEFVRLGPRRVGYRGSTLNAWLRAQTVRGGGEPAGAAA